MTITLTPEQLRIVEGAAGVTKRIAYLIAFSGLHGLPIRVQETFGYNTDTGEVTCPDPSLRVELSLDDDSL